MRLLRSETGRTLVVGHRGCEIGLPPNTLEAMEEGRRRGADLIEIDVQLSRDRVPFVRHHYADEAGRWAWDVDYADQAGAPLRLADAAAWARAAGVPLVLDLKSPFRGSAGLADAVLAALEPGDDVVAIAWDHRLVLELKERRAQLRTGAVLRALPVDLAGVLRAARCDVVCLSYDLARPVDVEVAHGLGVAVSIAELFVPDWPRALELGVDLVSYGDPAEARQGLAGA